MDNHDKEKTAPGKPAPDKLAVKRPARPAAKKTAATAPKTVTEAPGEFDDIPFELMRVASPGDPEYVDTAAERGSSKSFSASDNTYDGDGYYPRSRTVDESALLHRDRYKNTTYKKIKTASLSADTAERFSPSVERGLSSEQVEGRKAGGFVNVTRKKASRTYRAIFLSNMVTPINIIAAVVALAIIFIRDDGQKLADDLPKLFFVLIILINMSIGIFQEIRAKLTIEKLSLLTAPAAVVVRDGERKVVPVAEVVLDDIMFVEAGRQICADAIVLKGDAELNESLLTGESVPVKKSPGSDLFAGSFVASGNCYARVNKVGAANYVETLTSHAKKYRKPKSELYNSVGLLIKIIIPIALLITLGTVISYYFNYLTPAARVAGSAGGWGENIQRASAVMIGMLPMGMFLLTSTALFVSVIRLGKKRAVAKDFNSIEMLARVNVLCLDKTGTITDGTMTVKEVIEIKGGGASPAETQGLSLNEIVGSILTATEDNNQTAMALANRFGYSKVLKPTAVLPFSSARKLAAATFGEVGTFLYGAPEFVLKDIGIRLERQINDFASQGFRVLVLAHSPAPIKDGQILGARRALCLMVIEDHVREDAVKTIKWFKENNVAIKVISGDNPITVSEVARRVGVENADLYISLDGLSNREIFEAASQYTVFGRVTPEQKMLLVKALKQKGKTVAMTGDGVNDILAMRECDCAVAIASGAEAARNVAHLVLQDSSFASMPEVVMEGRKVVNNIQQSASLFLMKTFMTMLVAVTSLFLGRPYPYTTDNLLLLEMFVIAVASFALALQANKNLITGKFLLNVIGRSAPGGITMWATFLAIYLYNFFVLRNLGDAAELAYLPEVAYQTMLVLGLTFAGFIILVKICEPLNMFRIVLIVSVAGLLIVGVFAMPNLMSDTSPLFGLRLKSLRPQEWIFVTAAIMGSYFFMSILIKVMRALKILNY
ncbi:MAG: HAD-IC family P-type ATPase [Firmicutes bacterium]|nr:HAD-IC family P-type ATPase [Bacillota bacterium]